MIRIVDPSIYEPKIGSDAFGAFVSIHGLRISISTDGNVIRTFPDLQLASPAFTPRTGVELGPQQTAHEINPSIRNGQFVLKNVMGYWYVFSKNVHNEVIWKHVG